MFHIFFPYRTTLPVNSRVELIFLLLHFAEVLHSLSYPGPPLRRCKRSCGTLVLKESSSRVSFYGSETAAQYLERRRLVGFWVLLVLLAEVSWGKCCEAVRLERVVLQKKKICSCFKIDLGWESAGCYVTDMTEMANLMVTYIKLNLNDYFQGIMHSHYFSFLILFCCDKSDRILGHVKFILLNSVLTNWNKNKYYT